MQSFYETQPTFERSVEQELSYRVNFCWSTVDKGNGEQVCFHTREDSSFYEEDDRFEVYTSDESDSVLKSVQDRGASGVFIEDTYQPHDGSYNNQQFEQSHECPTHTHDLNAAQPTVPDSNCYPVPSTTARKPTIIERRNRRERFRVRAVNDAFARLRQLVPSTRWSPKRVSKRSTLLRAAEYIRELQQRLADATTTSPFRPHTASVQATSSSSGGNNGHSFRAALPTAGATASIGPTTSAVPAL